MLRTEIPFCLSHRLKHAAIRTCCFSEQKLYPRSLNDFANASICAASGPSSGRDKTTWSLITHFMTDSFPDSGSIGRSQYYVYPISHVCPGNLLIAAVQDIIRK